MEKQQIGLRRVSGLADDFVDLGELGRVGRLVL